MSSPGQGRPFNLPGGQEMRNLLPEQISLSVLPFPEVPESGNVKRWYVYVLNTFSSIDNSAR